MRSTINRYILLQVLLHTKDTFSDYNARGHKFSKRSRSHFRILGGRRETRLRIENLKALSAMAKKKLVAIVQNLVATATWRPAFMHP
jgi:hypothetical protein